MQMMERACVRSYKENYPKGTRVQLDSMGDDPRPVPPETKGTVVAVDDIGTVFVVFDNGRQLGICPEVNRFHKISEQTESQEPKMPM